ncbi:MAG: hypothetical protein EOP04_09425 [Proteobacteria bacterium]|nr:MAG: hypothetical protein EOP04_09425 [Pseudomonadota bacterium]
MEYAKFRKLKGHARYKALEKMGNVTWQIALIKLGDNYLDFTEAEMKELRIYYGTPEMSRIDKRIAEYKNSALTRSIASEQLASFDSKRKEG